MIYISLSLCKWSNYRNINNTLFDAGCMLSLNYFFITSNAVVFFYYHALTLNNFSFLILLFFWIAAQFWLRLVRKNLSFCMTRLIEGLSKFSMTFTVTVLIASSKFKNNTRVEWKKTHNCAHWVDNTTKKKVAMSTL
jgi:hypothetical protein